MIKAISCPNCESSIDPSLSFCNICGINLGVAATFAEKDINQVPDFFSANNVSPEVLVPRLGDYLIDEGYLSEEDLDEALAHQSQTEINGNPRLIGQTLVDLKLIAREDLDKAITKQIYQLRAALGNANIDLKRKVDETTAKLKNALIRLGELNRLKSNFLSNISHELRTPLTHIKGYLDLMVEDGLGPLSPDQEIALSTMIKSEKKLESLIEDLIQFSIASHGELDLNIQAVDLNGILKSVFASNQLKADEKSINLHLFTPDSSIITDVDQEKIRWVINQLLDNAIKFAPQHGIVKFGVDIQDQMIDIYVADKGVGIRTDKLSEIFEPFHQLDGSNTRKHGGTGLGLALVKKIVEAHGSKINVRSQQGKGSIFMFSLVRKT